MAAPCVVAPAFLQPPATAALPWWQRYWVKANLWIAIISYVGNYFWTHYFYKLLSATYTFQAHRINDVPIAMFLATHAYFCTYHSLTTIALRRWWTSATYAALPQSWLAPAASAALVFCMAVFTAFMETFTIQAFPYYRIEDRAFMYTVGSIVYGIYFIVSFPMYYRLDENEVPDEAAGGKGAAAAVEAPSQGRAIGAGAGDGKSSSSSRSRSRSATPRSRKAGAKASVADSTAADAGGISELRAAAHAHATRRFESWSLSRVAIDSLAGCMLVTILLDLWRISYNAAAGKPGPELGPPFMY